MGQTLERLDPETELSMKKNDIVEVKPGANFFVVRDDDEFDHLQADMARMEQRLLRLEEDLENSNENFKLLSNHLEYQAKTTLSMVELLRKKI